MADTKKSPLLTFETLCEDLKKLEAVDGSIPLNEVISYIRRRAFEADIEMTDSLIKEVFSEKPHLVLVNQS